MYYLRIFLGIAIFCVSRQWAYVSPLEVSVNAEAAILINAHSGAILYEKNSHTPHYPASITKIATTLYALQEKGDHLKSVIAAEQEAIASISGEAKKKSNYKTPSYWIEHASSHMGIKKGEEFTLKDLLYGVMVVSANDASNVIAQYVGGTIPQFVSGLNNFLKTLGCQETHFTNPHGLHHPKHQTTAYDMAIITREAMKDPFFRELASAVKFIRPKTNKQEATVMLQKNRLLRTGRYYYPKAIGVKTGYTSIARHTLVAAAKQNDRELIAVLLKCDEGGDTYRDAIALFDAAFKESKIQKTVLNEGVQKFVCNIKEGNIPLKTYSKVPLVYEYYPSEEPVFKCFLKWHELQLPIAKDQEVGEVTLKTTQGDILQTIGLYAQEDIKETWMQWLKNKF